MHRPSPSVLSCIAVPVLALIAVGFAAAPASRPTATPGELVRAYESLADAILAVKRTEEDLVRSILATTYAHAQGALQRARDALKAGAKVRESTEEVAAHVAQLGTEGDNAVAAVRKRLLEGGHHHNAEGERQGIFDPGFVIVTREAKKSFLDASRALGQLALFPAADGLDREWKKVEAAWSALREKKK